MEFSWEPIHRGAFCKLKQLLITSPVLAFPDFTRGYILETDASGVGLGAIRLNHLRMEQYTQLHMLVELSSNMKKLCYHGSRSTRYRVGNKTLPPLSLWTPL